MPAGLPPGSLAVPRSRLRAEGWAALSSQKGLVGEKVGDPLASVVLLTYERTEHLEAVLESILRQSYDNLEVIVVNNESPSSPRIEGLVEAVPRAALVRNGANLSFAAGMNRGIARARGRYVHLTVDDILLHSGCIEAFVQHMEASPSTGLAGGIMYNQGDGRIRCAGGSMALTTAYSRNPIGAGEEDSGQFKAPFDAGYVPGSMMFGRREVFQGLGGFRDDFFFSYEDVELCLRVRRAGHRIVVVPGAKSFHPVSPPYTGRTADEVAFHRLKNFLSLYLLHAPGPVLVPFALRYGPLELFTSAVRDRGRLPTLFRAWHWILTRMLLLLQERSALPVPPTPPDRPLGPGPLAGGDD